MTDMLRRYYADNGFGTELRPNPWMVHQKAAKNVVPWSDNFANWTRHNGTAVKNIFSLKGAPAGAYTLVDNVNDPLYPAYWECAAFALAEGTLKVWIEKAPSTTPSMVIKAVNAGAGAGSIEFNAFTGKVVGGTMPSSNVVDDGNWWILIAKPTSACERIQIFAPVDGQVGVPQVEFQPLKSLLEVELVGPIFTGINPGDTDVILYSWDFSNMSELGGRYYFDFEYKGQEAAVLTLNLTPVMYVENGMLKLTDGTTTIETPIHPGIQKVAFEFTQVEGQNNVGHMRLTLNGTSVSGDYDGSFGAGDLGTEYTIRNVEGWPCGAGRPPPAPFITTWRVAASDLEITLPIADVPRVKIDWGDGSPVEYVTSLAPHHTYATPGDYDVSVAGFMPRWKQGNLGDKLKIIDIKQWGTVGIENCAGMFYGCTNLGVITATDTPDFAASINMREMFRGCTGITHLDTSEWKTPMVTDMASMFRGCVKLTAIDGEKWDTSHVTSMENMFFGCAALTSVRALHWDTSAVTDFDGMFTNCALLASLDVTNWDTAACTSATAMFSGCAALGALRVTNWDVSNMQHMTAMFKGCAALQALDVESWRPAKALEMAHLFDGCTHVRELLVGDWKTPVAEVMTAMFKGCTTLTRLPLTNWDTRRVLKMDSMFEGCANIATFDIAAWNMARVINLNRMFYGCARLQDIDVTQWNIDEVVTAAEMFDHADLSIDSYDELLKAWSARNVRHNVVFSAWTTKYHAVTEKHILTSAPNSWVITDGGPIGRFVTTWRTAAADESIQLPIITVAPDVVVDWGDGSHEVVSTLQPTHHYSVPGDYDVTCVGTIPVWKFNNHGDKSKIIDVKHWGAVGATSFDNMFKGCNKLERISATDLLVITGSAVGMFSGCLAVTSIKSHDWDLSACTSMANMFSTCGVLTELDVSTWDTHRVTSISSMFRGCAAIPVLATGNWQLGSISALGFSGVFYGCRALLIAEVLNWDVAAATAFSQTFYGCTSLTSADTSLWRPPAITTFASMFSGCASLPEVKVGGFNVSTATDFSTMFAGCIALTGVDIRTWDTSSATTFANMFKGCTHLVTVTMPVHSQLNVSKVTMFSNMFSGCAALTNFGLSRWTETRAATNMANMFQGCAALTVLDLRAFNTALVTTTASMFRDCHGLTSLNVSSWDTSKVTAFTYMFRGCTSLPVLRIGNFNTDSATDLSGMFHSCILLTILDVDGFNTSNVTAMREIFSSCTAIAAFPVSSWDVSKVTSMYSLFSGCIGVTTIDLSSWVTSALEDTSNMFKNSSTIKDVKADVFDVTNVLKATNMFIGVALDKAAYDKLLASWGAQAVQHSVIFSGGHSKYSIAPSAGATGRAALVAKHWTITDGGPI